MAHFGQIQVVGNDPSALALLQRAADQVTPIMRKRRWTVRVLEEFYPKSQGLLGLNVNRGARIKVRLRQPGDKGSFLPYNSILGTLLHELVHNEIGNHSADFYRLLDELWSECEELMDRGITNGGSGAGGALIDTFSDRGHRLDISKHNPKSRDRSPKQLAADAALHRQRSRVTGPPRKLGGKRAVMHTKSPRELAAEAALRRQRDEVWCGSNAAGTLGHDNDVDVASASATLGAEKEGQPLGAARAAQRRKTKTVSRGKQPAAGAPSARRDGSEASRNSGDPAVPWTCGACTFANPKPLALVCEVCGTIR